jgi:hypothetical protein
MFIEEYVKTYCAFLKDGSMSVDGKHFLYEFTSPEDVLAWAIKIDAFNPDKLHNHADADCGVWIFARRGLKYLSVKLRADKQTKSLTELKKACQALKLS